MDTKLYAMISMVIVMLLISCTPYTPYEPSGQVIVEPGYNGSEEGGSAGIPIVDLNETEEETTGDVESPEETVPEELEEEEVQGTIEVKKEEAELTAKADITGYEGDLIDLKPYVKDPDGDTIKLGYTAPFNSKGEWQTEKGDAGFYSVIVSATDNKDSFVTKQYSIKILILNKLPVINMPDRLQFVEGDLVRLNPEITDADNDQVVVLYTGWMDSKIYQTTYEDEGNHTVTIRADDGKEIVTKDVVIEVRPYNRLPIVELESAAKIVATEGDLIELKAKATDPDGEPVAITYSVPFDEDGKWKTQEGDKGSYEVKVVASDGTNEVVNEILVEVIKKNTAPVINSVSFTPDSIVLKKPGDEVKVVIKVDAYDADNDKLTVEYSGFMTEAEKIVKYGEKGGLKVVKVTVSDGKESISKEVSFNMNNWPCFDCQ